MALVDQMDDYLKEALRFETEYISNRSVAIVIRDRAGNTALGTSTCIQLGDRFLLATAGHVIEDINDERIQLVPAGEPASSPLPFIHRSCSPTRSSPDSDVAWIELGRDVATSSGLRFLLPTDLRCGQAASDRRHLLVHGYPHQSAIISRSSSDVESTLAYTMMADSNSLQRRLEEYEIAIEYPPRDAQGQPLQVAPLAYGLSGGGVWWQPRHEETILDNPSDMRLIAINTKWDKASGCLFATRIDEWLKLVALNFPDTTASIDQITIDR